MIRVEYQGLTGSQIPEQQMWCKVLQITLDDLLMPFSRKPVRTENNDSIYSDLLQAWKARNECVLSARHFALSPGNDWRATVCDLAGVNEEGFMKRAKAIFGEMS